jgi:ribosomal-protein-alanine N-acetyltransferase
MQQKVDVLPLTASQLSEAAAIAAASFPDPWSFSLFEAAFVQPDTRILAAVQEGKLVGYLVLQRLGTEQSVDDIAVSPTCRRQGIAEQLLRTAHAQFPDCNFILEVREHNAAAIALYQKLGYESVGFRKRYYTNPAEGAVLMTRYAVQS